MSLVSDEVLLFQYNSSVFGFGNWTLTIFIQIFLHWNVHFGGLRRGNYTSQHFLPEPCTPDVSFNLMVLCSWSSSLWSFTIYLEPGALSY